MTAAKPTPSPWYQFSLRSLLLLTLFVAALCSIGVCTHWLISAFVVMVTIGGVTGRIVAGTRLGFLAGVLYGSLLLLAVVVFLPFRWTTWDCLSATGIAALIGGVVGGLSARPSSER
jgi:hydrogenase/urease accessory protein HupE